ncbi:hypothetical protein AVEN_101257-1 [Araneus ventricosus]|uniref:Uncharacterized protein n=1 Tax=Araneus ventricosus TaxID=182803 RepID=A0A4Y2M3C5_ARAVE|nr:hypothetical protein AVEN_101257-1 [Araneus ventricosus]
MNDNDSPFLKQKSSSYHIAKKCVVWSLEPAIPTRPDPSPHTNSPKARRERNPRCRENDPVLHNPEGYEVTVRSDRWKIAQVDRQKELITLWLFPLMKREGESMFAVGSIVRHPDKSWRLNLSATPQRAWSKVFLSWNLEEERGTRGPGDSTRDGRLRRD